MRNIKFNVEYLKTLTYDEIKDIYKGNEIMFKKALKYAGVKEPKETKTNKK